MKISVIIFLVFSLISICYADRICIEKTTGKLIEYQSGDAPLGTLKQNAVNAGYNENAVEEKYVAQSEWWSIREEQIDRPAREKAAQEELLRQQKEQEIQAVLGLTNIDFQKLKDVLKN